MGKAGHGNIVSTKNNYFDQSFWQSMRDSLRNNPSVAFDSISSDSCGDLRLSA